MGSTRPGAVGWTRIAVNALCGIVFVIVLWVRAAPGDLALALVAALAFGLLTLWAWMRLWTRFIVDERGVTVSWGGFLPRPTWPLEDFRTVQLREIPASTLGVTAGGVGWRRCRVMAAEPSQLRPVGDRKVFTLGSMQEPYRVLVTRPGTMVEIIGRHGRHWLLSPEDPEATAAAVDQAIRSRR